VRGNESALDDAYALQTTMST